MIPLAPSLRPPFHAPPVATMAWTEDDWYDGLGITPLVLGAGNSADTKTVNLGGFNTFMAVLNCSGAGGTLTASVVVLHPVSAAVIAVRQIATGIVPGPQLVTAFGAYTAVLPNDIYGPVKLRFAAAAAAVTFTGLVVYGQVR